MSKPLLSQRRFLPLFITQFFTAFNDNVFKQAILLLLTLQAIDVSESALYANMAAGLFILPFFAFSGMAGQLAESREKSALIRVIKLSEIVIMAVGSMAIISGQLYLMLGTIFLMGLQSTFFGPLKYSILPQHIEEKNLTKANGLIESATFIAILLGTVLGTYFIDQPSGKIIVGSTVIIVAIVGYASSFKIPSAPANNPHQRVSTNPLISTVDVFRALKSQKESVGKSVLGISWFWFIGAIILTALPTYITKELGGSTEDVTIALVVFSLSIAVGSLLCEKLSRSRIELGLVPFGAFLITLFLYNLGSVPIGMPHETSISDVMDAANTPMYQALFWMALTGIASGFYTVPLYALIQKRTSSDSRARIIAANNVMNALFMVGSAIFSIFILSVLEWTIADMLLIISALNLIIAVYIYTKVPEFFMRFTIYLIAIILYRVDSKGEENIPDEGPALIAPNHVSFIDWMFVMASSPRPIRFVIFAPIYHFWALNWLFKAARAIPIDSQKANPECYHAAMKEIHKSLIAGELVGIFPEGKLSSDGNVDTFRRGIEVITRKTPAPVIPVSLDGLWGSMFSRKYKVRLPRLRWSLVKVRIGEAVPANEVNADDIKCKVKDLLNDK